MKGEGERITLRHEKKNVNEVVYKEKLIIKNKP